MSDFSYDVKKVVEFLGGGIDETIVFSLIGIFVKSIADEFPALEAAVNSVDKEQIHKVGHKLKGSSASLGFESFRKLCEDLEQNARNDRDFDYKGTFSKLIEEKDLIESWYNQEKSKYGM